MPSRSSVDISLHNPNGHSGRFRLLRLLSQVFGRVPRQTPCMTQSHSSTKAQVDGWGYLRAPGWLRQGPLPSSETPVLIGVPCTITPPNSIAIGCGARLVAVGGHGYVSLEMFLLQLSYSLGSILFLLRPWIQLYVGRGAQQPAYAPTISAMVQDSIA